MVLDNGKGNVKDNRTTVDQLIRNEDGTYSMVETKLRRSTPYSNGQAAAEQHVGKNGGWFEVRSNIADWNIYKNDKIFIKSYDRKNKYE